MIEVDTSHEITVAVLLCTGRSVVAELVRSKLIALADSTRCDAEVEGFAPVLGDDHVAREQARRAALRDAAVRAERLGWLVSPSGRPVADLCPGCRARPVAMAARLVAS